MSYILTTISNSDGKEATTSYKPITVVSNEEDTDLNPNGTTSISDLKGAPGITSIHSPKSLKPRFKEIRSLTVNVVTILTAIAIFAFAFTCYRSNGNVIGVREKQLLEAARIVGA